MPAETANKPTRRAKKADSQPKQPAKTWAVTVSDLVKLVTQTRDVLPEFSMIRWMKEDATARPNAVVVRVRVHLDDSSYSKGVVGSQAIHNDVQILSGMLRKAHLEICNIDVEDWYPGLDDLRARYFDVEVRKIPGQLRARVLLHNERPEPGDPVPVNPVTGVPL